MIKRDFRTVKQTELKSGLAIWLDGRGFEDTNPVHVPIGPEKTGPVCGPFLVDRVLFQSRPEPRVDIIDPETGRRRSMMSSWLLVPKEDKC
tara:strand:+ start:647 stop:919 length:273 start_codon:yes stop_codon:yes gene_type:complete